VSGRDNSGLAPGGGEVFSIAGHQIGRSGSLRTLQEDVVIGIGTSPDGFRRPDPKTLLTNGIECGDDHAFAGGAYMASCAMCAGLGATIPGCLSSSPVPINNLTLHPAKMPDSLRCTFTLYPGMVSFCRMSEFRIYR
jgi:hypothetical protein